MYPKYNAIGNRKKANDSQYYVSTWQWVLSYFINICQQQHKRARLARKPCMLKEGSIASISRQLQNSLPFRLSVSNKQTPAGGHVNCARAH